MSKQFSIFSSHSVWIDWLWMGSKWITSHRIASSIIQMCLHSAHFVDFRTRVCINAYVCIIVYVVFRFRFQYDSTQHTHILGNIFKRNECTLSVSLLSLSLVVFTLFSVYVFYLLYASFGKKSLCRCCFWCWCFHFSWLHKYKVIYSFDSIYFSTTVCCSSPAWLDSHFLRQINGFPSLTFLHLQYPSKFISHVSTHLYTKFVCSIANALLSFFLFLYVTRKLIQSLHFFVQKRWTIIFRWNRFSMIPVKNCQVIELII